MNVITVEEVPQELGEYAKKHTYLVDVMNLDKRVRTLRQVFEAPKTNLAYARKMADRLWAKCVSAGRGDLAAEVMYIMYDAHYEKKRATNKQAAEEAKRRLQQCLDR
jgi:hypothetical protein